MMIMKQPKTRGFEYFPFYFKESSLKEEDDGPRIKFRRLKSRPPSKGRPVIAFAILALVVFVLFLYFGELVKKDSKATKTGPFEVEEIIVVE